MTGFFTNQTRPALSEDLIQRINTICQDQGKLTLTERIEAVVGAYEQLRMQLNVPVELVLFCPACDTQHIDKDGWVTRLHRSHLCESCGYIWRPADVDTVGVAALKTRGEVDCSIHPADARAWLKIERSSPEQR